MSRTDTGNLWVQFPRPNPRSRLRLFCFPYAGGGAQVFRPWAEELPAAIEVCPVQLPGRGNRLREPPFNQLQPLVREAGAGIAPYLDRPFAFFGHSLGAVIAFELARLFRRTNAGEPVQLFVSGRRSPRLPRTRPPIHDLPEQEFLQEVRTLNGTPGEVFQHPELLQLIIPALRADFEVSHTHQYREEDPFDFPIAVLGGLNDSGVGREALQLWQEETTSPLSLHMIPGDHFFLNTSRELVLRVLKSHLRDFIL